MKTFLCSLLLVAFSSLAYADIQDPPANDHGPTRKLSRGVANIAFGVTEIPTTIGMINEREGNSASFSYGIIKGVARAFYRFGKGVHEVVTFPFPTHKGTYQPAYKSNVPYIHGGYTEFPPEVGFESRYRYSRQYIGY